VEKKLHFLAYHKEESVQTGQSWQKQGLNAHSRGNIPIKNGTQMQNDWCSRTSIEDPILKSQGYTIFSYRYVLKSIFSGEQ